MSFDDIADLKKTEEVWLLLVRRVRGYVEDDYGKAARPFMLILYEIAPNTILRNYTLITKKVGRFPSPEFVFKFLAETMRQTFEELKQPPHRPGTIIFTSKFLHVALSRNITEIFQTGHKYWTEEENQGFGDDFIARYSKKLIDKMEFAEGKGSQKPGILSIEGVQQSLAIDLFKSAADFFREFPWKRIGIHQVFIISWAGEIRFFMVSGNKLEPGIIFEDNWENTKALIETGYHIDQQPYKALLFVGEQSMPFDDLDALERFGWDLASNSIPQDQRKKKLKKKKRAEKKEERTEAKEEDEGEEEEDEWDFCYPLPVCFPQSPLKIEDMNRPTRKDLQWLELASKVITKTSQRFKDSPPTSFREDAVPFFLNSGKATINYSFWASKEEWKDAEEYVKREIERINAPKCKTCGKSSDAQNPLKNCANCKKKLYCSRECQAKDWPSHKLNCKKV